MAEHPRQAVEGGQEARPLLPDPAPAVGQVARPPQAHARLGAPLAQAVPEGRGQLGAPTQQVAARPGRVGQRPAGEVGAVEAAQVAGRYSVARQRPPGGPRLGHVLDQQANALRAPVDAEAARRGEPGGQAVEQAGAVDQRLALQRTGGRIRRGR